MNQRVILVPLDGSRAALSALPVAKVLSEIEQSALRLVYVAGNNASATENLSSLRLHGPQMNGLTVETCTGDPAAKILQLADEIKPQMIVLCKYTTTEPRNVLGSTASCVLGKAPCPLVLVHPDRGSAPWHLHHVLVPHDGTPSTSAALGPAEEIAEHAGAELLVAHVTGVRAAPVELGSLSVPRYVDQPQHEWPAWTSEFARRLASTRPHRRLHVRIFLGHGNPAAEIMRLAQEQSTDLIVMAWRGVWKAPRAVIFKDVIAKTRCPVMVVRA
jgi:nucleotide-binding universal stress UspA family protein